MSEKDYAPLSVACVRGLCDKLYDKRKFAGAEIEKMVKDFSDANNTNQIKRLIRVLGQDLISSTNPNVKNGALMGLSSVAVGLGKNCIDFLPELIHPIIACFAESESRVRYQAAESLFNVVKIARGAMLPHFPIVFDSLARLAADPEAQVKQGAELLDRLVKDIVTESSDFDLAAFVPMLRERIYTRNAFGRQFIVSWVAVLDAVPDIDLILYLPELLDGLFKMLDDPNSEIRRMCDVQLNEFLRSIKKDPSRVDFQAMINILITHAQSPEDLVQLTAITWIKEFVELAGGAMLPYASGVLSAVLPCLAYSDDTRRSILYTFSISNYRRRSSTNLESLRRLSDDARHPRDGGDGEPAAGPAGVGVGRGRGGGGGSAGAGGGGGRADAGAAPQLGTQQGGGAGLAAAAVQRGAERDAGAHGARLRGRHGLPHGRARRRGAARAGRAGRGLLPPAARGQPLLRALLARAAAPAGRGRGAARGPRRLHDPPAVRAAQRRARLPRARLHPGGGAAAALRRHHGGRAQHAAADGGGAAGAAHGAARVGRARARAVRAAERVLVPQSRGAAGAVPADAAVRARAGAGVRVRRAGADGGAADGGGQAGAAAGVARVCVPATAAAARGGARAARRAARTADAAAAERGVPHAAQALAVRARGRRWRHARARRRVGRAAAALPRGASAASPLQVARAPQRLQRLQLAPIHSTSRLPPLS